MRRFFVSPLLVLSFVVLACAPARAEAALPITFEGLVNGTEIGTQYTASDGVTFLSSGGATGLPKAQDVGTAAHSGSVVALSQCFGCEFVPHAIKGRLATSQEAVSVRVGLAGPAGTSSTLTLEAIGAAGTVLGSTTATTTSGEFHTLLTIDPPGTDDVVFFRVTGEGGYQFGIDDVDVVDGGASARDFALGTTASNLKLRQGSAITVPIDVFRVNGSNGDVTLSALDLPVGVTGSFSPNPVTTTSEGPSTLTLSASPGAALANAAPITVRGTPADVFSGPGVRNLSTTLTVEPSFTVGVPATVRVPSCGSTTVNVTVRRAFSGFSGTVHLAVSGLPAGYTATFATSDVGPPSGGAFINEVPLTITKTSAGDMAPRSFSVTGSSSGLADSTASGAVERFAGELTGVSPAVATVPRDVAPGTEVTITGRGLCAGSTVQFGNTYATVTPAAGDYSADHTTVHVRVPRLATTGPITVAAPDGTFASADALTVLNPRATEGFRFDNYGGEGVTFNDLKYVYGEDQTNITLDVCWPFGCNVVTPIPSPFAGLYELISNATLAGKGSCYGMAVTSQQLVSGRIPYARFAPGGATNVWQLDNPQGPAPALAKHIRAWHSTQLSSEGIQDYLRFAVANGLDRGSHVRGRLEAELRAGHSPLIMVKSGGGGHVVVAMDVRPEGAGYVIDTYDPNMPFQLSENTDGVRHFGLSEHSAIHVAANGTWTFVGAFSSQWSGSAGDLVDLPFSEIPTRPTMPSTLTGLASLIVPFASGGATHTTQITDAAGNHLLAGDGSLNTDAATDIAGAQVMPSMSGDSSTPVYIVPASGSYTQHLVGTKEGTAEAGMIGPGFGAHVSGMQSAAGTNDAVTFDARHGELGLATAKGGNLHATLAAGDTAGAQYGADLLMAGADHGSHELGITGASGVHVHNGGGPATITGSLTYAGTGTAGTLTLPKLAVPAGGNVAVKPAWRALSTRGAVVTVRNARGMLVLRRTVKAMSPRRVLGVTVVASTVKNTDRRIRVTARFGAVPKSANVSVVVAVRRGSKLVATRRVTVPATAARGTRSYDVSIALPKGAYSIRAGVGVVTTAGSKIQSSSATATARFVAT